MIHDDDLRAACENVDPELHQAEDDPRLVAEAKAVCGRCPVATACLTGALNRREPTGVWGGLTTQERRNAHRRRRASRSKQYAASA